MDVRVGSWRRLSTEELMSFRTVVLEKTFECPLCSKKIKPVNPKGNQPWIFIGRTDVEAPILRPPEAKSQLTGKDSDAGKNWVQEEKEVTEDEMVGWHHWLNGFVFEQIPGDSEGPGSLCIHGVTKSRTELNDWSTTAPTNHSPASFPQSFICCK